MYSIICKILALKHCSLVDYTISIGFGNVRCSITKFFLKVISFSSKGLRAGCVLCGTNADTYIGWSF